MDHLAMKQAMINALNHKVSILEENNKNYFIQIEDSNIIMNALADALQIWLNSFDNNSIPLPMDIAYCRQVLEIYTRYANDLSTVDKVADLHNQIIKLVSGYND